MRTHSWTLLTVSSAALGAATAIALAWFLHRVDWMESEDSSIAWVNADGQQCLVQMTFARLGSTERTLMEHSVIEARTKDVCYERIGFSPQVVIAVRGDEVERPAVTFVPNSNLLEITDAGLPFRCLRERVWSISVGCSIGQVEREGTIPFRTGDFETLPGKPIWGGMIANTAVWGSPWMALFLFAGKVRRERRGRRGGCASCGYAMRGLAEDACCPECGAGR